MVLTWIVSIIALVPVWKSTTECVGDDAVVLARGRTATPPSRRRVEGVEVDETIQGVVKV